jgi:hypothetical protein
MLSYGHCKTKLKLFLKFNLSIMHTNKKFNVFIAFTTLGISLVQLPCQAQTQTQIEAELQSISKNGFLFCKKYQTENRPVGNLIYVNDDIKDKLAQFKIVCGFEKVVVFFDENGKEL